MLGNVFFIFDGINIGIPFLLVGISLFKPCIFAQISNKFHDQNPAKLQTGFMTLYISANFGAFISSIIIGFIGYSFGWELAFQICTIFLFLSALNIFYSQNLYANAKEYFGERIKIISILFLEVGLIGAIFYFREVLFNYKEVLILIGLGITLLNFLISKKAQDRKKTFLLIMAIMSVMLFLKFGQFSNLENDTNIISIQMQNGELSTKTLSYILLFGSGILCFLLTIFWSKRNKKGNANFTVKTLSIVSIIFLAILTTISFQIENATLQAHWLLMGLFAFPLEFLFFPLTYSLITEHSKKEDTIVNIGVFMFLSSIIYSFTDAPLKYISVMNIEFLEGSIFYIFSIVGVIAVIALNLIVQSISKPE